MFLCWQPSCFCPGVQTLQTGILCLALLGFSSALVCPDGGMCEERNTCCKNAVGGYSCCPLPHVSFHINLSLLSSPTAAGACLHSFKPVKINFVPQWQEVRNVNKHKVKGRRMMAEVVVQWEARILDLSDFIHMRWFTSNIYFTCGWDSSLSESSFWQVQSAKTLWFQEQQRKIWDLLSCKTALVLCRNKVINFIFKPD